MNNSLHDLCVVITRPADQAEGLYHAIETKGGHPVRWPALQIKAVKPSPQTEQCLRRINDYEHIIFISVNAVNHGLAALAAQGQKLTKQKIYAVGNATAEALFKAGLENVHTPDVASSEGLLAMPFFTQEILQESSVLIFRGVGGSEKLAKGLNERGAQTVDYAELYQRQIANSDPSMLEKLWQQKKLDIIIVTSIAGLDSLFVILGENNRRQLLATPLLTVSERVAKYAKQKGFTHQVLVAKSAIDKDLITAIQSWHEVREQNE